MRTQISFVAVLLLSTFNPQFSTAFAQGTLTPPGPPAPTMKSLDQIEARTPIASAGFVITKPGSYYLTTNLFVGSGADGIDIKTNGVTLDLNGFTIFASTNSAPYGVPYAAIGLWTDILNDITIRNGHIVGNVTNTGGIFNGNGFAYGIVYYGPISPSPADFRVSGVTVSGCLYFGILVGIGGSGLVESCNVQNIGSYGIYAANVSHCVAVQCGGHAIYANVVSSSEGSAFGSSDGIYAVYNAQNCHGSSSGSGDGIYGGALFDCYGSSSTGYGIYAIGTAIGCYGYSTSGTGLYAYIGNSCYANSENVPNKYNMP